MRATMVVATGGLTDVGEMYVLRNGATVFCCRTAGSGAEIEYTVPALSEGDTVAVKLLSQASRTLEDGVSTYLQITASRY